MEKNSINKNKKIETQPVADLIPYSRNPRNHTDEQVSQIASSILEFGFTNPILVDKKNMVIAGHGRLLAARKLKLEKVPTICLDYLTETQKRAYVIADNKLALNAGWDDEMLKVEFEELKGLDFDMNLLGTMLILPSYPRDILDNRLFRLTGTPLILHSH